MDLFVLYTFVIEVESIISNERLVEDCDNEVVLAQPVDYKDHKKCH